MPPLVEKGFTEIKSWLETYQAGQAELVELENGYTRLFRGMDRQKSPPPPYESVYVDSGLVYGPSTKQVANTYRRFQAAGKEYEPPDHITLELDFMRLLCEKEAEAWRKSENAQDLIVEENSFLNEHLARWVPDFCALVRQLDTKSFYSGLADITEGWLLYEVSLLKEISQDNVK